MPKTKQRCIMHLDMDAFFASVEQVDHPELRGKPVLVGGGQRGVVCAASYEARAFGVRSAMPMFQARRFCPKAVVVPVRMHRYQEMSGRVMSLLWDLSPLVEPISIDEAFVDLSGTENLHGPPERLAAALKKRVFGQTGLTCSIGIGPNKLLAKIASDMDKPDGLTLVTELQRADFMKNLPLGRIPGFGKRTVEILESMGIRVAGDVSRYPLAFWVRRFGKKNGRALFEKAAGIDPSPVTAARAAKSYGAENTFSKDLDDQEQLKKWLLRQTERVARELRKAGRKGRTITLKLKFSDFRTVTHGRTLAEATNATGVIFAVVLQLLEEIPRKNKVRLTGVSVSQFKQGPEQMHMFPDRNAKKQECLDRAFDQIRDKYRRDLLQRGRLFKPAEDGRQDDDRLV